MPDLAITVDEHEYPARVVVRGDLDLEAGDELEAALLPLLRPGARVEVVCDRIDFADSSGIAALVTAAQRAEEVGAHLVLTDPSSRLLSVLALTGTHHLFSLEGGVRAVPLPFGS